MNWDILKGKWKQVVGMAKIRWARLTDDDLKLVDGKKDELIGRIQERYGYAKDRAEKEVDEWAKNCTC